MESYLYEEDEDDSEDEDDEDEDGPAYETTCPNCEEEIFFDEDVLDDGCVMCPNCGEKLEFDLEDLSQEDDADEDDGDADGGIEILPERTPAQDPRRRKVLAALRALHSKLDRMQPIQ